MFVYPQQALFDRVVAKTKIYGHARPSPRVRGLFVAQVDEIRWLYKLSPETTNLPGRDGIEEIEVFALRLKTNGIDPAVLRAIDKAIPHPLLFELMAPDGNAAFAANLKRPSESKLSGWVIEGEFMTEWMPSPPNRRSLPVALDLAALYESLVRPHLPHPPRPGESLNDQISRCRNIFALSREISRLAKRLNAENQFNRKVALNADLRDARIHLHRLIHETVPSEL